MKIDDFLDEYFDIPDLQDFIDDKLGGIISGTKGEIIDRIVTNERFHPIFIYQWLGKDDLKELCYEMRLKVSGNKPQLWKRIVEAAGYFNNEYDDLISSEKEELTGLGSVIGNRNSIRFVIISSGIVIISVIIVLLLMAILIPITPQQYQPLLSAISLLADIFGIISIIVIITRFLIMKTQ